MPSHTYPAPSHFQLSSCVTAAAWPPPCAVCRLLPFTDSRTGPERGRGLARGAEWESWLSDCTGLSGPHPITLPHCFPRVPLIANYLGRSASCIHVYSSTRLAFTRPTGWRHHLAAPSPGNNISRRQPETDFGAGIPSCPQNCLSSL